MFVVCMCLCLNTYFTHQEGKTALQHAEAGGHTAAADAIRRAVELRGHHEKLRESARSGDVARLKAVVGGMARLNVDAADVVCA